MFVRKLQKELEKAAEEYPVVTLTGPRQSGKTTLVRTTFPEKDYVNLELPDVRDMAVDDPRGFLANYPNGAILDEVQRAPKLLSYLQAFVDEDPSVGQYILTGSNQHALGATVSQTLAGRTAVLTLLPLTMSELRRGGVELGLFEQLYKGFFPRPYGSPIDPLSVYRDYLRTYVERDLRQLITIKDLSLFQNFLKLCAGRIGQVINHASLANDVGVSANTIREWISLLETSYLIHRLPPYFENFGKRVIKSPKIYFTDVGLAAYLLGITSPDQLQRDPLMGNLVENLVVMELVKVAHNRGREPGLYFFRDSNGREVDLVYQKGRELVALEVKAAFTYNQSMFKGLNYFRSLIGGRFLNGYVVYAGDHAQRIHEMELINYRHVGEIGKSDLSD